MGQHMTQPSLGIDAIKLGRADQGVDGGSAFATAVGTGKQVVAATDGDAASNAMEEIQ